MDFGERGLDPRHVADAVASGDDIEGAVRKWQRRHVTGDERGAPDRRPPDHRELQHALGQVEAADPGAAGGERERDVAGAAREVERAIRGADAADATSRAFQARSRPNERNRVMKS